MRYNSKACNRFVKDMEKIHREVYHYRGRNFWEGPAVSADDFEDQQAVIRATRVKLQYDNLGRGYVLYPVQSSQLIDDK